MICGKEVKGSPLRHNPLVLCSKECRIIRARQRRADYKKTDKGHASEMRWRKNPIKKVIDKKSRTRPEGRRKTVLRVKKWQKTSEYGIISRKRHDKIYMSRTQGRLRKWWQEASANGCNQCRSFDNLGVDHIMAMSKGGTDDIKNLQVLCRMCNSLKGADE